MNRAFPITAFSLPPLVCPQDRRKEMVKTVSKLGEEGKVGRGGGPCPATALLRGDSAPSLAPVHAARSGSTCGRKCWLQCDSCRAMTACVADRAA